MEQVRDTKVILKRRTRVGKVLINRLPGLIHYMT